MNDTELDELLREAAPPVTIPAGLDAHQDRILREGRRSRRRRGGTLAAAMGLSAILVGAGTAAMSSGGTETPWGWVADNVFSFSNGAEMCFAGMEVKFEGVSEDSDIVRDSRDFVSSLDLETLDTSEAEADIREGNEDAVDVDGNSSPIVQSDAAIKQRAMHQIVSALLWEHLEEAGYPMDPSPISFYTRTQGCNE